MGTTNFIQKLYDKTQNFYKFAQTLSNKTQINTTKTQKNPIKYNKNPTKYNKNPIKYKKFKNDIQHFQPYYSIQRKKYKTPRNPQNLLDTSQDAKNSVSYLIKKIVTKFSISIFEP